MLDVTNVKPLKVSCLTFTICDCLIRSDRQTDSVESTIKNQNSHLKLRFLSSLMNKVQDLATLGPALWWQEWMGAW